MVLCYVKIRRNRICACLFASCILVYLLSFFLHQVFIAVPGLAGSPHIDSQAKAYQFTSQTPFRAKALRDSAFSYPSGG